MLKIHNLIERSFKFIRYQLTIILVYFLTGCCSNENDQYNYIPDENKLKYMVGDTLVYISNIGLYDTMFVIDINQSFDYTEIHDFCGTITYREILSYDLKSTLTGATNIFILSYKDEFRIAWNKINFSNIRTSNYKFYEELLINDILFSNIYELYPIYGDTMKLYYNAKIGCIKYDYTDGDSWCLLTKQ
jgi:hypothetical protein